MRASGNAALLALLAGCGPPSHVTLEQAANATYVGILDSPVTLVDAAYQGEPFVAGAASRPSVRLLPDIGVIADVDGTGSNEAIVGLVSSSGGSGTYTHLAGVSRDRRRALASATVLLGDRVQIASLAVDGALITAHTVEHGANDPMCCPTVNGTRQWRYDNGQLVEEWASPGTVRVRGNIVIGHEVRALTECDTENEIWLTDRTGGDLSTVYEGLATGPYEPIFMALEGRRDPVPETGFGADYESAFAVRQVIRAEREGFGCALDLTGFMYRASGNEPSWQLTVQHEAVSFVSMSAGTLRFDDPVMTTDGESVLVRVADEELEVEIGDARCTDSMSGSVYALTAVVRVDGAAYRGCAVEGMAGAK